LDRKSAGSWSERRQSTLYPALYANLQEPSPHNLGTSTSTHQRHPRNTSCKEQPLHTTHRSHPPQPHALPTPSSATHQANPHPAIPPEPQPSNRKPADVYIIWTPLLTTLKIPPSHGVVPASTYITLHCTTLPYVRVTTQPHTPPSIYPSILVSTNQRTPTRPTYHTRTPLPSSNQTKPNQSKQACSMPLVKTQSTSVLNRCE
jgi:hypothetical protein